MDDCIFCKIANKEIPTSLVYEDDLVAAFNDLSPQAPVHVLIVPKKQYQSVLEVPEGAQTGRSRLRTPETARGPLRRGR